MSTVNDSRSFVPDRFRLLPALSKPVRGGEEQTEESKDRVELGGLPRDSSADILAAWFAKGYRPVQGAVRSAMNHPLVGGAVTVGLGAAAAVYGGPALLAALKSVPAVTAAGQGAVTVAQTAALAGVGAVALTRGRAAPLLGRAGLVAARGAAKATVPAAKIAAKGSSLIGRSVVGPVVSRLVGGAAGLTTMVAVGAPQVVGRAIASQFRFDPSKVEKSPPQENRGGPSRLKKRLRAASKCPAENRGVF